MKVINRDKMLKSPNGTLYISLDFILEKYQLPSIENIQIYEGYASWGSKGACSLFNTMQYISYYCWDGIHLKGW